MRDKYNGKSPPIHQLYGRVLERSGNKMNKISIVKNNDVFYPDKCHVFRPDSVFPEYIYQEENSSEKNFVYAMIREGLHILGLDEENYDTANWNPLRDYVTPGDTVLIKPNMVLHNNASGGGTDCLYTNPSLVAAIIDYVLIALQGQGKIIIGDAPLQECVFQTLIEESGYDELIEFYKKRGVDITLVDYRNVKTVDKNGLYYLQEDKSNKGIIVNLDELSAFSDVPEERMENLRITNYDPRILQKHHHKKIHEYKIAEEVLSADVIINMPKPKTHRKAGVTIALKNLVGINANKEFLPHHTLGSREEGGDAYQKENDYLKIANMVLDIKNMLVNENEMELADLANQLYGKLREKKADETYWEGSWYGNDTIWRTILDLNNILYYADKNGKMCDVRQRKMFIVGDMIVSGEKEGPLEPTPIYPGVIVMGDNPVLFDMAVCSLMGFDYKDIPSINMPGKEEQKRLLTDEECPNIVSNCEEWNNKSIEEIRDKYSLKFEPSDGWVVKLGSPYLSGLIKEIKNKDNKVYIFGAGSRGILAAIQLLKENVEVVAFCDNNRKIWDEIVTNGIVCIEPNKIDIKIPVLLTVNKKYLQSVTKQIQDIGGTVLGSY